MISASIAVDVPASVSHLVYCPTMWQLLAEKVLYNDRRISSHNSSSSLSSSFFAIAPPNWSPPPFLVSREAELEWA